VTRCTATSCHTCSRSRWRLHPRNMFKPSCAPWACARRRCRPVPGRRALRALGVAVA